MILRLTAMHSVRIWSSVSPVIRGVVGGRAEIINSVKSYNSPTVSQHNPQWSYFTTVSHQISNGCYQSNNVCSTDTTATCLASDIHKKLNLNCKVLNVPFATSVKFNTEFQHNENNHAHDVLLSIPAYSNSTIMFDNIESLLPPLDLINSPPPLPHIDWSTILPHDIAGSFIALSRQSKSHEMKLSSAEYKPLIDALIKNLPSLTNEQLISVLAGLTLWPSIENTNSRNYCDLWSALDRETVKRVKKWGLQQAFIVADLWFALKLSRIGCYTSCMLSWYGRSIKDMSPQDLVQYLFHINLNREHPANVNFSVLECCLAHVVDQLSLDELGVVAMGLFKAQSFMKTDELVEAFYAKLLKSDLSGVSSITIGAIFKVLRKSTRVVCIDKLYKLLDQVQPLLSEYSLLAQLQIALVGSDMLIFNPKVINEIALNFVREVSSLRMKDIERITLVLMLYNHIPPEQQDILDIFAKELRKPERLHEINKYPKSFLSCVNYMATMGVLPHDLISTVFHPLLIKSLQKGTNYSDITRELMELDCIIDIEFNDGSYTGNRLEPELKDQLIRTYFSRYRLPKQALAKQQKMAVTAADGYKFPSLTHAEKLLLDVENKFSVLLGGQDRLCTTFVLPHVAAPDIVFCTGPSGDPVPLPPCYLNLPPTCIKQPLLHHPETGEELKWTAVVVGGRNGFIRGSTRPRGQLEMKLRHLRKLGYTVAMVPYMMYNKRGLYQKLQLLDDVLMGCGALPRLDNSHRAGEAFIAFKEEEIKRKESFC